MCYHVASPSAIDLKKRSKQDKEIKFEGTEIFHVSGFARPFLPVTLSDAQEVVTAARWKLLPFWVKNEDEAAKYANTLNAESDSIFEKASYKNYIRKNRGLLYVKGFFEPHQVNGQKATDNYFIYMPKHEIFTLGIVWSPFTDQDTGEHYNSFSIITTAANPLLEEIHNVKNRMPLIIPQNKQDAWLNATKQEDIKALMKPYENELAAHKVYRVTGARGEDTNRIEIQKPIS